MDTCSVLTNLNEMMMMADNEKSFRTLSEAIRMIKVKGQHTLSVPCSIGDILYSIVGERVNDYKITGFRIDSEKTYMESEGSMLFAADKIGTYYFFSQELAEREFKKWRGRNIEKHHA